MATASTYSRHVRAIMVLGLPLAGGHLAQFAIGMTDTIMLGWYGAEALAAITLASGWFFVFFMLGSGFGLAVMPLVAQASTQQDATGVRRATRMGLWLSLVFALLMQPVMFGSETILRFLGQGEALAQAGGSYLRIAGWGLIPALAVMVLKSYLAALERTQAVLWVTLLGVAVNAVVNFALIFGKWGAPELGLKGAAIASVATQIATLLAIMTYVLVWLPENGLFRRLWKPDLEVGKRVLRLGFPIGVTALFEVSLFVASALMMGWLGTVALAAHGIAITVTAATFMVHLGLSNAATIRAGFAMGRGDRRELADGARAVLGVSLCWALATIAVFLLLPEPILSIFLDPDDPARDAIIALGVPLMAMAALFQLMDGSQAIALGLLRGVQDTAVPAVIAALSYFGLGIPTSYVLGFVLDMGGIGVWLGLVIGLAGAGLFLMLRFWLRGMAAVDETPV